MDRQYVDLLGVFFVSSCLGGEACQDAKQIPTTISFLASTSIAARPDSAEAISSNIVGLASINPPPCLRNRNNHFDPPIITDKLGHRGHLLRVPLLRPLL